MEGSETSTTSTEKSTSVDVSPAEVTEAVSETDIATTKGTTTIEDIKQTSTVSSTQTETQQPTDSVTEKIPDIDTDKVVSTSSVFNEIAETTDGPIPDTTTKDAFVAFVEEIVTSFQTTTQKATEETTTIQKEQSSIESTESSVGGEIDMNETGTILPLAVTTDGMEGDIEDSVLNEGADSSGDGPVTDETTDMKEVDVVTTETALSGTTAQPIDISSESVDDTTSIGQTTASSDVVSPDGTTLLDDKEGTTIPADPSSSIEPISITESISLVETTVQPETSSIDGVEDEATSSAEMVTTDMPILLEVSSETAETTISIETSSSDSMLAVEETTKDMPIQPETSSSDEIDESSTMEVIIATNVPETVPTSSETGDVTTSGYQTTPVGDVSTPGPEDSTTSGTIDPDDETELNTSTEMKSEEGMADVTVTTVTPETIDTTTLEVLETSTDATEDVVEEDIMTRCLYNDTFYENLETIPSDTECELCQCVNGIKVCAERECGPPPENYKNCQKIEVEGNCCPTYECDEITTARSDGQETSRQPNLIPVPDIPSDRSPETVVNDSEKVEDLPKTVEAMTQTTEMNNDTEQDSINGTEKLSMMCILLGDCKDSQPQGKVPEGTDLPDFSFNLTLSFNGTEDILDTIEAIGLNDTYIDSIGNETETNLIDFITSLNGSDVFDTISNDSLTEPSANETTTGLMDIINGSLDLLNEILETTADSLVGTLFDGSEEGFKNTTSTDVDSTIYNETDTSGALPLFKDSELDNEILDDDADEIITVTCTVDGVVYDNLASIPSEDPCKLCYCQYGATLCASRDCAIPVGYEECTPLPKAEDKCCPEQFECSKYF